VVASIVRARPGGAEVKYRPAIEAFATAWQDAGDSGANGGGSEGGVAEFLYFTGPMDCGKSTLALQFDYTQMTGGRRGRLFTSRDRAGEATISSRLGLSRPAVEVAPEFNFWLYVVDELTSGERIDYLVCDESQFYSAAQIDQLARIVDELQIDVFAVGILTDFKTRLFPGSQRLVELCDRMEVLQARALCWCGERATHNARTVNGTMVTEGDQIMLGDTQGVPGDDSEDDSTGPPDEVALSALADLLPDQEPPVVAYEVLCRRHHRRGLTRAVARATLSDPLPFGRDDDAGL
jgi:thymidine kinase